MTTHTTVTRKYLGRLVIDSRLLHLKINKFIWSFKVADNIKFNLDVVDILHSAKNKDRRNIQAWNKLLIITETSIIEAVLHDFIIRLTQSGDHFPITLISARKKIKSDIVPGNYSYKNLIELLRGFALLGTNSKAYDDLLSLGRLRNRVHIYNWHQNFEKNERIVYTEERLKHCEQALNQVIDYMAMCYSRPWGEL